MSYFFENPELSDFKVISQDGTQKIPVHLPILRAESDYFNGFLAFKESKEKIYIAEDFEAFKVGLECIYKRFYSLEDSALEHIRGILDYAKMLQLKDLTSFSRSY